MLSHSEMLLRMFVGAALGGVIGYERDRAGRPVGLRTHVIVALASATFMLISTQFAYYQNIQLGPDSAVRVDTSRIAASVVTAIGFLAGGSILRSGLTIQGLTTAAGLWLVTALGMCAGSGMYVEAIVVTLIGVATLTVFRRFEDKDVVRKRVSLLLSDADPEPILEGVSHVFGELGVKAKEVEYERFVDGKHRARVVFDVVIPVARSASELARALEGQTGVLRIGIGAHASQLNA
jgi:putative Mg2+ transporter-C (MgtC) family protein